MSKSRKDGIPKTYAKIQFCLSDRDVESLTATEKKNPYSPKGPAMKLYKREELERLAVRKFGSLEKLEEERQRRQERRNSVAKTRPELDSFSVAKAASHAEAGDPDAGLGLPPLLSERVRVVRSPAREPAPGSLVLYWMKAALRGHHNPALDAARREAAKRGAELAVAAPVLLDCPHANARRVKFVLEGLRDAQRELGAAGVDLLVHVP
eukprot:CAMPEP_0177594914 /NCGR_PEP_ID=MMETSP0419_2-20121207/10051_1 /TAXON_ID=582737 /ORGANISM="Tetraselmis sp., Strain GSL018" /LENGTH=208 /DNA_ID=CAMNT_0019086287 /DNA_START=186 /DNA_END=809 /DNA_ORIENTATION=+